MILKVLKKVYFIFNYFKKGILISIFKNKDQENFNNIINHISNMDYLNGVCILLKPNVSRLSLQFRYCFKELMVHLHKSALPNILFCFTNTRG